MVQFSYDCNEIYMCLILIHLVALTYYLYTSLMIIWNVFFPFLFLFDRADKCVWITAQILFLYFFPSLFSHRRIFRRFAKNKTKKKWRIWAHKISHTVQFWTVVKIPHRLSRRMIQNQQQQQIFPATLLYCWLLLSWSCKKKWLPERK